ncbi:unnamed protein product [Caenorhabditis angaria]|uniref:Uncharacterized protein n=1 Tax=Caenorhabditis angaria TaxID=860376 RepID=A0A9P1I8C3_9PELO|nr:unnamed protein product [Caenorhabditis angaria]
MKDYEELVDWSEDGDDFEFLEQNHVARRPNVLPRLSSFNPTSYSTPRPSRENTAICNQKPVKKGNRKKLLKKSGKAAKHATKSKTGSRRKLTKMIEELPVTDYYNRLSIRILARKLMPPLRLLGHVMFVVEFTGEIYGFSRKIAHCSPAAENHRL